jgi:PilZ domain
MAENINQYYMERREHRRIPFNREVEVIGIGMFLCSSLSSGGLYLETVNAFPVGTVVDLRFKLRATDEHPLTIQACVIYRHEGVGAGFRFVDLNLEDHEKIVRFIDQE